MPLVIKSLVNEVASEAVTLGGMDWDPVYDPMLVQWDKISTVLSSVSNPLDSLLFANALVNDATVSKFKMSMGATSALPPDISDDLWCEDEPMSLMINLNNIKQSIELFEAEVGAIGRCAKGVTAEYLSKVWSIDIENTKRTIDVTTQLRNMKEATT